MTYCYMGKSILFYSHLHGVFDKGPSDADIEVAEEESDDELDGDKEEAVNNVEAETSFRKILIVLSDVVLGAPMISWNKAKSRRRKLIRRKTQETIGDVEKEEEVRKMDSGDNDEANLVEPIKRKKGRPLGWRKPR
ncbi:unnamed protein product [Caenorhabditis nigoni]